jgi:hypothetical protein
MGFNSQDDLINEVTNNGKFWRADWNKIVGPAALVAGGWYDFSQFQGVPLAVRPGELVINGESPQTITGPVGNAFNWTANGTAWVASAGVFAKTSGTATTLSADSMAIPIVIGRRYRVQYTITAWTSSNVNFTLGGATGTVRAAVGTYIEYITATTTANLVMQASVNTGVFSINNISVVEWGAGLTSLNSASQIITDTNNQGAIYHGGNVSTDTKHLLNMAAVTAVATGVPAVLMLVDLLQVYPFLDANSLSAQALTNQNAQTRYANGLGVRAFMVPNRLSATIGATAHNLQLSYTNTASVAARAMPVTVSATASLPATQFKLTHTGLAANQYGPFLPMAQGDQGIKSVETYQQTAASGTANTFYDLIMCKPLATIPLTTASVAAERDLVNQLPSMPQIKDGACLGWLYFAGNATGASTNFYGSLDLGWG